MTGPEHYQEAERLLERYADTTIATKAVAHALLALAAATALRPSDAVYEDDPLIQAWQRVAGGEPS